MSRKDRMRFLGREESMVLARLASKGKLMSIHQEGQPQRKTMEAEAAFCAITNCLEFAINDSCFCEKHKRKVWTPAYKSPLSRRLQWNRLHGTI